ncbi:MAG: hypothetical protein SO121_05405 [Eggerthellaceae bacterium]|nr:hypothetical protein [Eggerthellaceae bacterium]
MKNTKRLVAALVAVVLVIVGIVLVVLGQKGQSIYNDATAMLGCKKPETINYILDTSTITGVSRGLTAKEYTNFLAGKLGLDSAEVEAVVADRVVYDEKLAYANDYNTFIEYVMETQGVTEDEAKAIKKDDDQEEAIQNEILLTEVTAALGCDEAAFAELQADTAMIALFQKGFDSLTAGGGFNAFLFNNAIMLLWIGIVLIIAGGAVLFIQAMDDSNKKKKAAVKVNPKAQKVGEFFLNYALYIILIAILVVVCLVKPNFLDPVNILNILKQASTKGILALGCAGLIVLAGTDLSIGRVLGLSAAVTAALVQSITYSSRMFPQMTHQLPLFVPLLASIGVAVIFSLVNGFGVAKLHLHAFIITLGTQLIAYGCNCLFIESQPSGTAQALSTFDQHFLDVAAGSLTIGSLKVPLVVLYFLGIAVIMWVVWNKTRLGKNMFAVGGNTEAAAVSGVNVAKTIMLVYLIAGILYGISAFLEAARITSVGANTGINYETDAISAVVVGGVSFSGGVGTIQGVVIGAIILQAINYSLQFLGVNPYLQYVVRGLIIILAVAIDVRKYIAKK